MAAPTCSAYPDKQMETRQWQGHRPPTVSVEHDLLDTQTPDDGRAPCNAAALASDTPLSSIKAALLIATETPMIATLPIRIKGGRVSDLKEHAFCVQDAAQHLWKQDVHVSVQEALASPASGTSAGSSLFLTGRLMELDLNHERDAARSKAPLDVQPVDPLALTIREALTAMAEGVYTSVDLVEMFLDRIDRLNDQLRAVISACPASIALAIASQRDAQRSAGGTLGPLHGIPITVKDNVATDEELGMPTTAGSYALLGMPVKGDAFIVERLRDAGAIIIAKANMSELNDAKSSAASPGWSAVGGQTVSAFGSHVEVGTSSSGSGVAVAAGFCLASVGTETDGSITLPCLYSGLYGLKPTVGLVSRSGVVPYTNHMDSPGPMCRSAWDVAAMLDAMVGWDGEDGKSFEDPSLAVAPYTSAIDGASFAGLRIGIPREGFFHTDPWGYPGHDKLPNEVLAGIETAIRTMQCAGAEITDPADLPCVLDGSYKAAMPDRSLVITAEYKEYLGRYLQGLGSEGGCRSAADIIEFNEVNAALEQPLGHSGQDVLRRTEHAVRIDSPEYAIALANMRDVAGARGLDAVMDAHGLDALLMFRRGAHAPANMVGYPIATVPIGLTDDGRPHGAFFIGRAHSESRLLRIMSAWEQTMPRRPLPSATLPA